MMTADELKALPKGIFVVTKTGFNPIKVKLKLFFKWEIEFEKTFILPLRNNKDIFYVSKEALMSTVYYKYTKDKKVKTMKYLKAVIMLNMLLSKNYSSNTKNARKS